MELFNHNWENNVIILEELDVPMTVKLYIHLNVLAHHQSAMIVVME